MYRAHAHRGRQIPDVSGPGALVGGHGAADVQTLRRVIPICGNCGKARDDDGYWKTLESHVGLPEGIELSHGICPECGPKLYGELWDADGE